MAAMLLIIVLFSYMVKSADRSFNNTSTIRSISCGTVQSQTLYSKQHLYSFTTSEHQDITFSLCNSPWKMWMSQIDLYNHQHQHQIQCSGTVDPIQKQTDSITAICNSCLGSIVKSSMTLKGLNPGSYYIQISNTFVVNNYPTYTLNMDCEPPTTTPPTTSTTTWISEVYEDSGVSEGDEESGGYVIIVAVIIVMFVVGFCIRFIIYANKPYRYRRDDASDGQRNVIALSVENVPIPSAPVMEEKVALKVSISDDEQEGFGQNVAPGAVVDDQREGNVDSAYDEIVSFFYDKVNIDDYNDIYIGLFIENGFNTLDILKTLSDVNLKAIGIDKLDHRQKIMSEISNI